jgi:NADPH:quinone reductase-like Zn-dependent oxidoreductase
MQGLTDSAAPDGLRLAVDLAEPQTAAGECVVAVHAFSINYRETMVIRQRSDR